MEPNRIKQLWRNNETVINAWISIPDSWTAEVIAHAGYDTMTIDAQHGLARDLSVILPMLQAIKGTKTIPLIRVPQNDPAFMMSMLDAGAMGIICPMINNREETEKFVRACRFYPKGIRSFGPLRASVIYGDDYFTASNNEVITMAMIETADAIKNLKEIASTPDLDGLYVGPWDLSISLGYQKMADFEDPSFLCILREILDAAAENGISAGIHSVTPEMSVKMSEMGFRFVTTFSDSAGLKKIASDQLETFKQKKGLSGSNDSY
jgi:4-hydroxy-2-oxoheptanedioate aldolase